MITAAHTSAVHAYEHGDELVVEIELPAGGKRDLELTVDRRLVSVKVPQPPVEQEAWRIHADATPC